MSAHIPVCRRSSSTGASLIHRQPGRQDFAAGRSCAGQPCFLRAARRPCQTKKMRDTDTAAATPKASSRRSPGGLLRSPNQIIGKQIRTDSRNGRVQAPESLPSAQGSPSCCARSCWPWRRPTRRSSTRSSLSTSRVASRSPGWRTRPTLPASSRTRGGSRPGRPHARRAVRGAPPAPAGAIRRRKPAPPLCLPPAARTEPGPAASARH